MVVLSMLAVAAYADPGAFSVETRYTNSFGPDAWGSLHARAQAQPGLEVGALIIGGNRSAVLGTTRRVLRLSDAASFGAELQLGTIRTVNDNLLGGPTAGFATGFSFLIDTITIQLEGGYLHGVGVYGEGGVDVTLSEFWTLSPRLRTETWSGDRDPALRVQMGLGHTWRSGLFISAAGSAGGRDVVHMGPGFTLDLGRSL